MRLSSSSLTVSSTVSTCPSKKHLLPSHIRSALKPGPLNRTNTDSHEETTRPARNHLLCSSPARLRDWTQIRRSESFDSSSDRGQWANLLLPHCSDGNRSATGSKAQWRAGGNSQTTRFLLCGPSSWQLPG